MDKRLLVRGVTRVGGCLRTGGQQSTFEELQTMSINPSPQADRTGFRYFSEGAAGAAHDLAHRLLDENRLEEGWHQLGVLLEQLDDEDVTGPKGAHLQWHMAVFEIAVGCCDEAHERFRAHLLPLVQSEQVLTDAPSLLWRLWVAGHREGLEWDAVAGPARRVLGRGDAGRYVLLHQALAVAGARDLAAIDRFLDRRYLSSQPVLEHQRESLFLRLVWALRTFANRDFACSAELLDCESSIGLVGGSGAQNELFGDLRDLAEVAFERVLLGGRAGRGADAA